MINFRISKYPASNLGEYIKKWRLEQGLLQTELAKMLGVNEMTIVNWETGKTKPTVASLKKIEKSPINSGRLLVAKFKG